MTASALISAKDLTVVRNGTTILDRISLDITAGNHVTIIGPNGAGKTTLLHCLLGLEKPDTGTVTRQDGLVIGYMPQQLALNNLMPLTVARFLRLGDPKANIAQALEEVGAAHVAESSMHQLSGGEKQRVLLAYSLLGQPDLLVLDEPAQQLDITGQIALYERLQNIQEERQCTILMVSHDLHHVMSSTHQVVCLFHHICCSGQPESIVQEDAFLSLYGTHAAQVLAHYSHTHSHAHDIFEDDCQHDH